MALQRDEKRHLIVSHIEMKQKKNTNDANYA